MSVFPFSYNPSGFVEQNYKQMFTISGLYLYVILTYVNQLINSPTKNRSHSAIELCIVIDWRNFVSNLYIVQLYSLSLSDFFI